MLMKIDEKINTIHHCCHQGSFLCEGSNLKLLPIGLHLAAIGAFQAQPTHGHANGETNTYG